MDTFKSFFQGLTEDRQADFARVAGTTVGYINTHLIHARKRPRERLMQGLVAACEALGAPFGRAHLVTFFFDSPPPDAQTSAQAVQAGTVPAPVDG